MPIQLGQASGGWTESSSALRVLYVGIRNSEGVLGDDAFTQTNPPAVATNVSTKVDTTIHGVLSGSVAFARPDLGSDYISGPGSAAVQLAIRGNVAHAIGYKALGVFINNAVGNAYENLPGVASGRGPYVCAMGTYGNQLYETAMIGAAVGGDPAAAAAITYYTGVGLIASRNGYLMPSHQLNGAGAAVICCASILASAEGYVANSENAVFALCPVTSLGVVKMPPDAGQAEVVYDQRI